MTFDASPTGRVHCRDGSRWADVIALCVIDPILAKELHALLAADKLGDRLLVETFGHLDYRPQDHLIGGDYPRDWRIGRGLELRVFFGTIG